MTTVGVDFSIKSLQLTNGINAAAMIYLVPGQEIAYQNRAIPTIDKAHGIVLVYDVMDPLSLERLAQYWIPEVYKHVDPQATKFILVGNKWDSPDAEMKVPLEVAQAFADKYQIPLHLTSAKSNINIASAFDDILTRAVERGIYNAMMGQNDPQPSLIPKDLTLKLTMLGDSGMLFIICAHQRAYLRYRGLDREQWVTICCPPSVLFTPSHLIHISQLLPQTTRCWFDLYH